MRKKFPGGRIVRAALSASIAALGVMSGASAGAGATAPVHEFRADHMVLDAALRGSEILAATQSGRVEVFDRSDGAVRATLFASRAAAGQAFPPTAPSVAVSPSGQLCAVVTSDGRLRVFDLAGDAASQPVFTLDRVALLIARFTSEDRLLLGDMRGELALVDLATGTERYRHQLDYDPIYAIAQSPNGRRVAVAFRSSRIRIVAPETGEPTQVLEGHRDSVFGLAWLSDDQLASAGKDKHLLLWDLARPGSVPRILYAADHYITALAADSRRGRLALPLADHRIGLLRVADGRFTQRLSGHTAPVRALLFADAGATLISAGSDARVLVWKLASEGESR